MLCGNISCDPYMYNFLFVINFIHNLCNSCEQNEGKSEENLGKGNKNFIFHTFNSIQEGLEKKGQHFLSIYHKFFQNDFRGM
jgi:hypothetical protein